MSLPSEELARLHLLLKDSVVAEAAAQREAEQAQIKLKAARTAAGKQRDAMLSLLDRLYKRPVNAAMLEKIPVGKTVNELRKHAAPAVAAKSQQVVRAWKSLVDQQHRAGATAPSPRKRPLESPSTSGAESSRRVLDSVCDDRGRRERRVADPDSHEDQLAVREAQEAERMWEEKMGSGSGSGGRSAALQAATARLEARYGELAEQKQRRKVVVLNKPQAQRGAKAPARRMM